MLTFFGESGRFCDSISRRSFLQVGGLALGGLSLPGLLRAEAVAGARATGKSVINIFLSGGPPHIDMFDLKPAAPAEYRGEFAPIATNVPGMEICELMPELAGIADRYTVVRSLTGVKNEHNANQSDSGWSVRSLMSMGGRPGLGAVMSKVLGPAHETPRGTAPTFVDLSGWTSPGFLGPVHRAFRPDGDTRASLRLRQGFTAERLDDRRSLLNGLDRLRRDADATGAMTAMDSFTQRAVDLVASGKVAEALDVEKEDAKTLERYGENRNRNFLMARRLIEAGVRCVAFSFYDWDTHQKNFYGMRIRLPNLSRALTALIEDFEQRGLLDDTIIMMSGEFGRTPRINNLAGRDHWNQASFFFLAGGGLRHGQMIGTTDARAEAPIDRPIHLQQVFATVYRQLGIDPEHTQLFDPNGRPQYLLDEREPIGELI
ncbi:MAG: DUF1501 domain-containing protein [Planctomycetaceae bacterium]